MTVALSSKVSDEGAVCRLLLSEAASPSNPAYNSANTLTSMQWMKRVLQNRLDNDPAQFMAPGATSLTQIIKAPNQFSGFVKYPDYDQIIRVRIQSYLDIANSEKDRRAPAYTLFVQNACTVATFPPCDDPTIAANIKTVGLCGWRTLGHGSPGARFARFSDLAGITFYYLSN